MLYTLALLVALAAPPAPAALPAPVTEALEENGVSGVRASFVVEEAPAAVLAALWDVERITEISPDVKSVTVLSRSERSLDVRFQISVLLFNADYTLRRSLDKENLRISWVSIAGDIKSARGSWTVKAQSPTRSFVTYTSFVDVGGLIPSSFARDHVIAKIEKLAGRVRKVAHDVAVKMPAPAPTP